MSFAHNDIQPASGTGPVGIPSQFTYAQPMEHRSEARLALRKYTRQLMFADGACVALASLLAFALRFPGHTLNLATFLYIPLISVVWLLVLAVRGGYTREGVHTLASQQRLVSGSALMVFAIVATVAYGFKDQVSRGFLIGTVLLSVTLLSIARSLQWRLFKGTRSWQLASQRALLIGSPEPATDEESVPFNAVAHETPPIGQPYEAWLVHVRELVATLRIDIVLLGRDHQLSDDQMQRLAWSLEGGVDIVKTVDLHNAGRTAALLTDSSGAFLILREAGLTGPKKALKRFMDLALACPALLLAVPLMLATAVAIKITSKGPVLFKQERVGQFGRSFTCLKFRSMKLGAQAEQTRIWAEAKTQGSANNKHLADPRVTAVGRVIRKLSVDELPQLWNVIRGDMSLVGPRPVQFVEIDDMERHHLRRQICKPGVTGLWQVSGRSETSWDQRMKMDLLYVETWSLGGDLRILLRTVRVVVQGLGAA